MTNNIIAAESSTTAKNLAVNVNTRIVQMLAYSKQAVLVVDKSKKNYSQVGSNFLAALADNNAAFLALSDKLDDIQIRCRLIDQLFPDTLFDPEESLAITLLKLAADNSEVISIVVENVQLLSLQLMHEFCQLASLAVKSDRTINVLLVGEEDTGKLIAKNKTEFDNKILILSAQSGQLLKFNSPLFNEPYSIFSVTRWKVYSIIFAVITLVTITLLLTLYQEDSFTFSGLSKVSTEKNTNKDKVVTEEIFAEKTAEEKEHTLAEPVDILLAINEPLAHQALAEQPIPAPSVVEQSDVVKVTPLLANQADNDNLYTSYQPVDDYYLMLDEGYVIQIRGFFDIERYDEFHKKYAELNLPSFHRIYNKKVYIFVTTPVYDTHKSASSALADLAQEFKDSGAWVKSVTAIKNEIKLYQTIKNEG